MLQHQTTASAILLASALALAACGPGSPDGRTAGEPPPPADTYETRGLVRQLPRAERPGSELYIHHEAVPDFRDADGEVVGMESMAMPFPVADPSMLDGLEPGDKVAFTFEMRWEGGDPLLVTRLEKLPPETRLAFEQAAEEPESGETEEAETDEGEIPTP
jgi:hypothetical protein